MAMRKGSRVPVGSTAWVTEERSSALTIAQNEIEEFSFSARNELDWLNEHMAEIFSETPMNVTELFKTPGKLRGKTPRTARRDNGGEIRVVSDDCGMAGRAGLTRAQPLSDVFGGTPQGAPSLYVIPSSKIARGRKMEVAEDKPPTLQRTSARNSVRSPHAPIASGAFADSGYHGSQEMDVIMDDLEARVEKTGEAPWCDVDLDDFAILSRPAESPKKPNASTTIFEETSKSAEEGQKPAQTVDMTVSSPDAMDVDDELRPVASPCIPFSCQWVQASPKAERPSSPSQQAASLQPIPTAEEDVPKETSNPGDELGADDRSISDASSPIRPVVRKSSITFASLPAREPLTSNKSLGGRVSRTSHLEQTRTSYYGRNTGGKSLGGIVRFDSMNVDEPPASVDEPAASIAAHNKTYTQQLQDQINALGKPQTSGQRGSKSNASLATSQQQVFPKSISQDSSPQPAPKTSRTPSPTQKHPAVTPGAFPQDDDDDDWIAPPTKKVVISTPRPETTKSHFVDVESVVERQTIEGSEHAHLQDGHDSPRRTSTDLSAVGSNDLKSASVPSFPTLRNGEPDIEVGPKKLASVSSPSLVALSHGPVPETPKSASRTLRDSALKQVKNKLTSIFKTSRGLLASSAALSAEGKTSLLSPSSLRLGQHRNPTVNTVETADSIIYPDLSQQVEAIGRPNSSTRSNTSRKTRASIEREKKEAKDARRLADRMEKLENAREKEREKARVFNQQAEQERQAQTDRQTALQRELDQRAELERRAALQEEQDRARVQADTEADAQLQASVHVLQTPAPAPKSSASGTRVHPRKPKTELEREEQAAAVDTQETSSDEDVGMVGHVDATTTITVPPPSIPRPTVASASRGQALKRPVKPTKETGPKVKPPTLIRVNTTSSQQSQFHPSNSALAANLQDTLGSQPANTSRQVPTKTSQPSLGSKASNSNLKSSVSSSGRPKALELAAKKKEQEEREAQRRRAVKAEMERKREEEQQRKVEAERLREEERMQAEKARKEAQRQAMIEQAKKTRAPPPAPRARPNGPPIFGTSEKAPAARPPSRLESHPFQEQGRTAESSRPVNAVLASGATKLSSKRPLQLDGNDESSRSHAQRNPNPSQANHQKRMRMSEEFDEDIEMADGQRSIKGPPVRPSNGYKKDLPSKSAFVNGYTAAPQSVTLDLFKATVTAQHNSHSKALHGMNTAQFSKGAIPFAPNTNSAGPSHRTPARPAVAPIAKSIRMSATRSSPRLQNGDAIELPEIDTDDDYDDEGDEGNMVAAAWADSPELKLALAAQERIDPAQIFGRPGPINMEEMFSKDKARWHKFRARTSSANWSGTDKLTDEDTRKDLQARDKMRKEGGWTYDLGRDFS